MPDIFSGDFARNPWPVLRSLREADPGVHRVATPDGPPAWLVTRFDTVRQCLIDENLSTNVKFANGSDYRGFPVPAPLDVFQTSDPGDIARLRRVLVTELAPRHVGEWGGRAAQLIEPTLRQLDGIREFDFVDRVAVPLPALVLSELLGLPPNARDQLLAWANSTMRPAATPRARDTLASMQQIIRAVIDHSHQSEDQTMLTRLARPGNLSTAELAGVVFYMLFVWYEVLIDLLAGTVLTLSTRPAQLAELLTRPDLSSAVDELLRYLSPQVLAGPRFAVTDLEIDGQPIAAGQTVLPCLASANHDPQKFDRPDEFDINRNSPPHLALGYGTHACVGTALIRPIATAMIGKLYSQWPRLRVLDDEQIPWRSGFRHRGPLTLPVKPA
ncbi:cytochrome P450 [Nocardia suismassiliense]|uniref:cytochrome P450 n=1 Tax=Nocardia suismassiliense TaxID=2077092 RepID=UPI00131ED698|nr:cytochrome P450 [Nocardia suismassiliense]